MQAPKLSAVELEVLRHIADGFTDKQIAIILGKSFDTVRKHRGNLFSKTDRHNRVQLTRYAINAGLVSATWRMTNENNASE